MVNFEIIGEITDCETFAMGHGIPELSRLYKAYGIGHWRKRKGFAEIRMTSGVITKAELHWYEASGIGKKEFKIKRYVE